MKKVFGFLGMLCLPLGCLTGALSSCIDDSVAKDSYYTFTGQMVSDYLAESEDYDLSEFSEIVKKAGYWDLLSTYGSYTCFAPTNDAINEFLLERGLASVEAMSKELCDSLTRTHLIDVAVYTTDGIGDLSPNFNKTTLNLTIDTLGGNVRYNVNNSGILVRDDSVENGVMFVIDRVINTTSDLLVETIYKDPNLTIFSQALRATGIGEMLDTRIKDESYEIGDDSIQCNEGRYYVFGGHNCAYRYPAERLFKYTIFAEPNSVFESKGIQNFEDLVKYANKVYHETYPEDLSYDNDYTNSKNPLNRFVMYHILDFCHSYENLTFKDNAGNDHKKQFLKEKQDIQEFYETMCPYTMMKISESNGKLYVNRRSTAGFVAKGAQITEPSKMAELYKNYTTSCANGMYYYVDDIVQYDVKNTIKKVLNDRIRIDASTLSPDFMTARGRNPERGSKDSEILNTLGNSQLMIAFKRGFIKNFILGEGTFFAIHEREGCLSYEADMCACLENFDIKFKLPPVPADETYEIRIGYQANPARTVLQVYFDTDLMNEEPCGIPVDLRIMAPDFGWIADSELEDEEEIEENDKSLRNQGYMKGPGSFEGSWGDKMRDISNCLRRVLTTKYLASNHTYYLRLRQVLRNNAEMSLDYIEIVPKSVYNNTARPEDRN